MTDNDIIDGIMNKLRMFGGETQLTDSDKAVICKTLEDLKAGNRDNSPNIYELVDRDACPIMYLDVSTLYPKEFVIKQINECIADEVDTCCIRSRLAKRCGAREISLEHIILPHIE